MIESLFQTLLFLAYFDISVIATTIANYAISASFLGRETQLTRNRMERRRQFLLEKIGELQKESRIVEIKREISVSENKEKQLGRRLFLLSWQGAVVIPLVFLVFSLIFAMLGLNSESLPVYSVPLHVWIGLSIITVAMGFMFLLAVIRTIDSAAKAVPLPKLEIRFETDLKAKYRIREKKAFVLSVENSGDDIAEDVTLMLVIPKDFKIESHPDFRIVDQGSSGKFPNRNAVVVGFDSIYVDTEQALQVTLSMPDKVGKYELDVAVFEKKIGTHEERFTVEVVS